MVVKKPEVTVVDRINWIVNTLYHQAIAIITVYVLWVVLYNYPLKHIISWHMFLSTFSYMPLMAEAIILFSGENVWSQKIDRTKKYWIHGGLMFSSFALITVGIFIETYNKGSEHPHFKSIHALIGFISWIFFVLLLVPGVFVAKNVSFDRKVRPVYFKFIHNVLGMTCFVLGLVSLCYGLKKRIFTTPASDIATTGTIYLIGIVGIWSLIAPLLSAYNQLRAIFSS